MPANPDGAGHHAAFGDSGLEAMDNERSTLGGGEAMRWAVAAGLVAAGIVLFFMYGRHTEPVVTPSAVEASS